MLSVRPHLPREAPDTRSRSHTRAPPSRPRARERVGHSPYQRLEIRITLRIGDDAFVLLQGQAYTFGVRHVFDAQGADGRESIGEKRRNVGLPNGGLRIVPHLRLVDGNAAHELDPTSGGASGVGEGGRDDDALAPEAPKAAASSAATLPRRVESNFL